MAASASNFSSEPATGGKEVSLTKAVGAALIGNTLEWFDLSVYAYFAVTIGKVFFPSSDSSLSLLMAFATFGVSFLIRPIGAIVLGAYADRAGRKKSLTVSLTLMLVGMIMIAVMPSYATIGALAPAGIMVARLFQGFSAGGEFGSSTAFMMEHAPKRKRVFVASLQFASQGFGTVIASLFGYFLTKNLTPEAMQDWGWRVPFFFGLSIAPVGLYLRSKVDETPDFAKKVAHQHPQDLNQPITEILAKQKLLIVVSIGVLIVSTASTFLIKYMPTYAAENLKLPQSTGFLATLLAGVILTLVTPVVGLLADKVGRINIMLGTAIVYIVSAYPLFLWLNAYPTTASLLLAVGMIGLIKAIYFAPLASIMSDIFPLETRVTGMSLSYSIGVSVFGGFAPAISIFLIRITGTPVATSYYLVAASSLSICALLVAAIKLKLR
ncbi:MHS family proline/betaine transporter-like MFS transporter [Herbaspirillum sp. Sphag1AN]|uniref:MFS transporter n=1 Tax=unclassified Herbaspirillum TaxID=2624150 RepID=UPI00160CC057|nr:MULTISPECIES: MFS transporter [unclassified Herbaspirillum]MBB3214709.1 MHS family proline/betaine transporter-like MFS transporter [Herbaspirillum sp. Sphag1AN]MBB3247888.1 MHS family proline/betaine transporter-like MFS transporter [Herbaspirillum sp. Sphag64]